MAEHSRAPFHYGTGHGCKSIRNADNQEIAFTTGLADDSEDGANALLFVLSPEMAAVLRDVAPYKADFPPAVRQRLARVLAQLKDIERPR